MRHAAIAISVLCLAPTAVFPAQAQPKPAPAPQRYSAHFYRLAADPGSVQASARLLQALTLLQQAAQVLPTDWRSLCERTLALQLSPEHGDEAAQRAGKEQALQLVARQAEARRSMIDAALATLDSALALAPQNVDLLYVRARALAAWEQPVAPPPRARSGPVAPPRGCDVQRRDTEASAALELVMQVDPGYAANQVAFELGIERTRLHDFAGAAEAYARAIELTWRAHDAAISEANLAEVTMLAGDPAGALPHYQQALGLSGGPGGTRDYALARFGIAVAEDRLGEHEKALTSAAQATESAGRTLSALEADGVFFEPAYERHYYLALGHESLAQLAPEARAAHLAAARLEYQAFVTAAPESDPYREAAQTDLGAIVRELAALPHPVAPKPDRQLERLKPRRQSPSGAAK